MAQCTQLIQTSTAPTLNLPAAPPSPTPLIWTPLVQAPLQAAAATTPLALALAHHSTLPQILLHNPLAPGSGSVKEHGSHLRRVQIGASSSCGSGSPTSPAKSRPVAETPSLGFSIPPHLSTGFLSACLPSQPVFTSSLQPVTPLVAHPPHCGVAPVFPISQTTVSYTCSAQLHSQPFHGAMTTPPLGLLQQGAPGRLVGRLPAPTIGPLICSSVNPILSQLQQACPPSCILQTGSTASSDMSLPHFPIIPGCQSSAGPNPPAPVGGAGAAALLAQHTLAGLQSAFLPQVLPEHSALASLAQYGSAEDSPSYTPPLHSPCTQSPVRGQAVSHSELPPTISSPSSRTHHTSYSRDPFSQEIKTISGSHSCLHQERPLVMSGSPEGVAGVFSSPMTVSKLYTSIPGQAAPLSRTHAGPEPLNPSGGVHSPLLRSPAKTLEHEHKQSKLSSNL